MDGQETSYLTPSLIPHIKIGKHKVTLRWIDLLNRSEYVAEDTIEVTAGDSNSFRIEFKPVSVTLVCNAEHTKLYLNGRLRGEGGDLVIDRIIPGTYNLRLKQNYGLTAEKQVYFPPNTSDCPPECFIFGNLNVVSEEIDNVPILINGISTDRRVPAVFSNLIIGEYEVSAEIDGKRVSRKVVVKANEESYVHLNPIEIAKELKQQEAAKKVLQRENALAREALEKEKKKQEKRVKKITKEKEPKENLSFGAGITAGVNGTLGTETLLGYGSDLGLLAFVPINNLFYIQSEIRYFTKNYGFKSYFYGDYINSDDNVNVSYLFNFWLLRKKLSKDLYMLGGYGFGLYIKSDKLRIMLLMQEVTRSSSTPVTKAMTVSGLSG